MAEPQHVGDTLEATMARLNQLAAQAQQHRAAHEAWAASQPQSMVCDLHRFVRPIDWDRSVIASRDEGKFVLRYVKCAKCLAIAKSRESSQWLLRVGVPADLVHASFDNFSPRNADEEEIKKHVQTFSRKRVGFLCLLGEKGNGKTHLAVSVLRETHGGFFITNLALLDKLRERYGNNRAADIKQKCKDAKLLVLDELGLSSGGADELPMMHDILNHRHANKLRTIITGNFEDKPEFIKVIGSRMADRLSESCYKMLWFTGASQRPKMKQQYFDEATPQDS